MTYEDEDGIDGPFDRAMDRAMRADRAPSLSEALAARGYTHAATGRDYRHAIKNEGRVVFTGAAHDVWAWMKGTK